MNQKSRKHPTMTVVQMFHATLSAFFLSAIYLRTGSVVFPIFAHGIYDYICFVTDPKLSEEGILTQQYSTWQIIAEICIVLIIGIAGIYMLRKARFADINEVWDKKRSQMTCSAVSVSSPLRIEAARSRRCRFSNSASPVKYSVGSDLFCLRQ